MEGRLVQQLDFSAAFDRVSHDGLCHQLRSIGVGEQFLSKVFEFLSDRRQLVILDDKVSALVDMVLRVAPGYCLG